MADPKLTVSRVGFVAALITWAVVMTVINVGINGWVAKYTASRAGFIQGGERG